MFFNIAMIIFALAAAISAFALIRGSSKWNRLLGLNLVAGKMTLIIIVMAVASGNSFYLDIAIVYILLSFIGTVALSDYLVERNKKQKSQVQKLLDTARIPIVKAAPKGNPDELA